jgi:hypothetical protein
MRFEFHFQSPDRQNCYRFGTGSAVSRAGYSGYKAYAADSTIGDVDGMALRRASHRWCDLPHKFLRSGSGGLLRDAARALRPPAFLDQAHYSIVKTRTFNGVPLPAIVLWGQPGRLGSRSSADSAGQSFAID